MNRLSPSFSHPGSVGRSPPSCAVILLTSNAAVPTMERSFVVLAFGKVTNPWYDWSMSEMQREGEEWKSIVQFQRAPSDGEKAIEVVIVRLVSLGHRLSEEDVHTGVLLGSL